MNNNEPVINVSTYCFAALTDLKAWRERLIGVCREGQLKGTILLSTEGINMFVAGRRAAIEELMTLLRSVAGLEGLTPKISESREQPFSRMLVKIKKEIIAFGIAGIDPINRPAPRLSPRELKQWLDEGRPVTLLDTRNDYEVHLGTFRGAIPVGIQHFRDFPQATANLDREAKSPIVTFCTGGIRCEKAAPYMIQQGFANVYQLDGGILKYFEECGHAHFEGECFVFDKRVGVAADLDESGYGMCFVCQHLLTPEELTDPLTVEGVSCPHCYRSPEERQAADLAMHRERLQQAIQPLPGQRPADNFRPIKISARHDGLSIVELINTIFSHIPSDEWQARLDRGDLVNEHRQPVASSHIVHAGECYFTRERLQIEPDVNANITILHEDDAIIVINKPAPLPMHPSGRFNRNTLQSILCTVYTPHKPRPAHRLDANTSGLAVFSRTAAFAKQLQPQFERGEVQKVYLARVQGHPMSERFECHAPISAEAGRHGSRIIDEQGLAAHTEFAVLDRFPDGTALLRVVPRTGRTNQIRVHLWHLGLPIVGDPMYRPNQQLGDTQTLAPEESPLCLHAWQITFKHPQGQRLVRYEAPPPTWANTKQTANVERESPSKLQDAP